MDWNKGFSSRYYASRVDPNTWRDVERFELISGSVSRVDSGTYESADIDCREFDTSVETWIRIYLDTRQGGSAAHVPIFTGLASTPEVTINGNVKQYPVACYSVLQPADDVLLPLGWYAPTGANSGNVIRELLKVTPAPVTVEANAPELQTAVLAEESETNLSMVQKLLNIMNWRLRIMGDGEIVISPKPLNESATFDAIESDSVEPQITVRKDWFSCPNVLRATVEDLTAIARDDSADSPLSTVNRGREVWAEETSATLNVDEGIAEYSQRRLKEKQTVATEISYSRRFLPDVYVSDYIRLHYPRQGLEGLYRVVSQTIELSHGARTSEEVTSV